MHIGLIGGIGPAATDFYYRKLITRAAEAGRNLELTMVHADSTTLLANLTADNQAAQCSIYSRLAQRLVGAGADNLVVTSIAGHFCIDAFSKHSPLPIIDITQALSAWLNDQGLTKVGILGTNVVVRSGMYGKLKPVEIVRLSPEKIERVHRAYVTLAQSGRSSKDLEETFLSAGNAMMSEGAEAILLGGTDLNAALNSEIAPFPIVDCAGIHVDAVAKFI